MLFAKWCLDKTDHAYRPFTPVGMTLPDTMHLTLLHLMPPLHSGVYVETKVDQEGLL